MRVIRKIGFFSLLAIVILFTQDASATLTSLYSLPDSTFAEEEDAWQGRREYEEGALEVFLAFCVYDTDNLLKSGEIDLAAELDLTGQYIYAYQIWNHPTESFEEVPYFQILDIDENPINEALIKNDTGSYDDGTNGIAPTPQISETQGVWEFEEGVLIPGKHSWFLVFSSDYAPVAGSFTFEQPSEQSDMPVVPEPATMALLGLGSTLALIKRRKSLWQHRTCLHL